MSETLSVSLQTTYESLAAVSAPLAERYAEVAAVMQAGLTAAEVAQWGQYSVQLAQCGWRTWESAETFLKISPFLLEHIEVSQLWTWAEQGMTIAQGSGAAATAFFQAARPLLRHASQEVFATWVAEGRWYLQHYPARPALAIAYFHVSPQVYGHYPLAVCKLWGQLGQDVVQAEPDHGHTFFEISRAQLDQTAAVDYPAAWDVARHMVPHSCEVALHYLERYTDLAQRFEPESMARLHTLLLSLLTPAVAHANAFLRLIHGTLGFVPPADRMQILEWCEHIATVSQSGALAFLQQFPDLGRRVPVRRLQPWIEAGLTVAQRNAEAGHAYFALESAAAQDCLRAIQKLVAFADVERVLQLYTEGFLARHIELRTTAGLPAALRRDGRDMPTTDGTAIFVPEEVDDFAAARENFAVYKMAILHQVGFYECGTFRFSLRELLRRVPGMRSRLEGLGDHHQEASQAAFAQFFAFFPSHELARRLFTILEDARIDAYLAWRYKGIRDDLALIMRQSLAQRPPLLSMPLRQALLEGLLQWTLGGTVSPGMPAGLRVLLPLLCQRVQPLQKTGATVYDTAVAVLDCYRLIMEVPARAATTLTAAARAQIESLAAAWQDDADMMSIADLFRQAGEGADAMPVLPESTEPAEGVEPVPYRGDVKPELIQKQLRLQELSAELQQTQETPSPLSPEVLKELLEKGTLEIKSVHEGDLSATSGLFVNDLEGRAGVGNDEAARQAELQQEIEALRAELHEEYGELTAPDRAVFYDEWDYLIGDYRKRWCRLFETVLDDDGTGFVHETRRKYADLLTLISRQFQLLKPEMFKKIKRLVDGEDIDLDSAIEAIVDRRAGNILSEKVYMRRNKRDRSVAALFLLDMSASTDDEVPEADTNDVIETSAKPQPRLYDFSGFVAEDYYTPLQAQARQEPPRRRIIDVEKEALVLMAEALETLGDAYAIYGFSGYGRDQVDFFVAKEFTERYDERVQGRIAAIKPHRSTRMGPAIRHAIRKLERQDARIKTLLMLSDGYPQDYDYGKDRKSKEHGIQDTMMALHEARLKGIQTFCLTVDPAGHDYLREMCPDQHYLVLDDIASLPNELPKIYRGLTT